jgi:hypothetical protein
LTEIVLYQTRLKSVKQFFPAVSPVLRLQIQ